jgi:Holliday junction resolvase-like predicted endonuclease
VEQHLRAQGWRFLGRRVETRFGELDLLFADDHTLVVIEVKTGRAGARFSPGMRFGREALAQRWRAADALARGRPARVDLVEVTLDAQRRTRLVHHRGLRRPL